MLVCRIQALILGQPQVSKGLHHGHTGYRHTGLLNEGRPYIHVQST